MSEIKTKIERMIGQHSGEVFYLITEKHTIADIARWAIEEGYSEDLKMFLINPDMVC